MRIAVAADHAGLTIKRVVREYLIGLGHAVEDFGVHTTDPVDYPDYADVVVLVLGGRVIGEALARELVLAFTNASFTGEERHRRRLAKIRAREEVIWQ